MSAAPALISIHDLMPETLGGVRELLAGPVAVFEPQQVVLLVVPGLEWRDRELDQLRAWRDAGYELAGHGWRHRAERIRGLRHRLHSLLISGRAAEHLSLSRQAVLDLVARNAEWFPRRGLGEPELYVPPAWARGALSDGDLRALPFRYWEFTGAIRDSAADRECRLPLAGFEADRRWRVPALRLWNACNARLARPEKPLRIAIHPRDHRLLMAPDLERTLATATACQYRRLFPG